MANVERRRKENVEGLFFVDETCIDCDHCRFLAPTVFGRADMQSAVRHQPERAEEEIQALRALLTCPTGSIGTTRKSNLVAQAVQSMPIPIAENVYYTGYASRSTAAATSYFLRHPDGNVLIDSPKYVGGLVKRLEELGGVRYMYLTHIDHLGDHQKFRDHFGCERIIHEDERNPEEWWDHTMGFDPPPAEIAGVEHQITGREPVELLPSLRILPVPGHTRGNTILLYRDEFLFSGDHLFYSPPLGHLAADRLHNWWSWPEQIESMRRLAGYSFEWILPGHQGGAHHVPRDRIADQMAQCVSWMEQVPAGTYVAPHPSFGGPEVRHAPTCPGTSPDDRR